jgi:Flp pilus assembly protein TadG
MRIKPGIFNKLASSEDGSSLIEAAVMLPLMVSVMVCLTDYAIWAQKAMQLQTAADAGAIYGTIPGNATNTTMMTEIANYNATGSLSGSSSVTVSSNLIYTCSPGGAAVTSSTLCSGVAPLEYVQVSVQSAVSAFMKYPGVPSSLALSGWASYRVEGTP